MSIISADYNDDLDFVKFFRRLNMHGYALTVLSSRFLRNTSGKFTHRKSFEALSLQRHAEKMSW
jgi:hypothetical protein